MVTHGQAIDKAIQEHTQKYPGSEVYKSEVAEIQEDCYYVELRASHFSQPLQYWVPR